MITDELREWKGNINTRLTPETVLTLRSELNCIADRIDAEHESACAEAYGNGVMSVPIALDESQWVKLPVDADGVPIHIGDVMETEDNHILKVDVIQVSSRKWSIGLVTTLDSAFSWHDADRLRHYHAPTVEDVLRECIANVCKSNAQLHNQGCPPLTMEDIDEELDEYINEYAVRLRLAEEVDA